MVCMLEKKNTTLACLFWLQHITERNLHLNILILIEMTQTLRIEGREKNNGIDNNWQKDSVMSNTNWHNYFISEQILVQQASWYTENPATTLLIHLLLQHGTNHGYFAKFWEQTLPSLNQRRKTNLFTTCWEILAASVMDGLGCIGKLITNFIGLMAALRREIFRSGGVANQVTLAAWKIVWFLEEATLMENGVTEFALWPTSLLSASGQFRWE